MSCEVCDEKYNILCGNCKKTRYCSLECQVKDYAKHKLECLPLFRNAEKYNKIHVSIVITEMIKRLLRDYDLHQNKVVFRETFMKKIFLLENKDSPYASDQITRKNSLKELDRLLSFWYIRGDTTFKRLTTGLLQVHFRETWKDLYGDECYQFFSELVPSIFMEKLEKSVAPQEEGTPFLISPFVTAYSIHIGDFNINVEFVAADTPSRFIPYLRKEHRVYQKDYYNVDFVKPLESWFDNETLKNIKDPKTAKSKLLKLFFKSVYEVPKQIVDLMLTY